MGKYYGAVVTQTGQTLIAQAIAEEQVFTFTNVRTSSHVYPAGTNLALLTVLDDIEQTVAPSYAAVYDGNIIQVAASFTNANVQTEYYVNTIGLYGRVGTTGTESLIAVIKADVPDVVEVGGGSSLASYVYNIQMFLSNASSVSVSVTDAGVVLTSTFNAYVSQTAVTIAGMTTKSQLQALDTPETITIATTDWTASGSNWTATKSCSKASTDAYCVVEFVPDNPSSLTAANLKTLQKNLSYIYPCPTLGNGTVTFTASKQPTIALSFSAIGGAVT